MHFDDLEKIGIGMYGMHWQNEIARDLGVKLKVLGAWSYDGVPQWVLHSLDNLIKKRMQQVREAEHHFLLLTT